MKMKQNNNNSPGELNLLIPNIDTTSERLPSENTPGVFMKNILTEKNLNQNQEKNKQKMPNNKKFQKFSNNLISKTMRNNQQNFCNYKKSDYSQKETQEITQKNNNLNNKNKANNNNNIVKKINTISMERAKKENNKIPTRSKRNLSKTTNTNNKDSYLYLIQMKRNYSSNKLKDEYSTSTTFSKHNKIIKSKEINTNKKNLTLNNFYPPHSSSKASDFSPISTVSPRKKKSNHSINKINKYYNINDSHLKNKLNRLNRNISFSYYNKNVAYPNNFTINNDNNINDMSEILKVRKKFNETCKYFYCKDQHKSNNKYTIRNLTEVNSFKKIKMIKPRGNNIENKYTTSDYSSINPYWNKREKDTIKKMSQIKNDLLQKEQNEIQSIPKISEKSKELAINSGKFNNIEFNNIYDRLFYINNLNLNLNIDNENSKINSNNNNNNYKNCNINNNNNIQYQPLINEKSKNIKRTVNDLYLWQNEKERKIKENEENLYKQIICNKKITNVTSEEILKERRPNYSHKKVEDRLIEQGKNIKIKNEIEKEKSLQLLTEQKTYINDNFNNYNNIKSKYLEQKNNNLNNNNEQNENIQNDFYTITNLRNFDNYNKKVIYYGDKLNSNSFYYFNKYNDKSLNNNNLNNNKNIKKNSIISRSQEKIKCFDDNNYSKKKDYMNDSNYNNYNLNSSYQRSFIINQRTPKDFNKISRPQTFKNNNNSINQNINNLKISDLSSYSNNYNNYNDVRDNEDNKNKKVSPYFTILYNDMYNYNTKVINEVNNSINNEFKKINQINLNNNDFIKNEISINTNIS